MGRTLSVAAYRCQRQGVTYESDDPFPRNHHIIPDPEIAPYFIWSKLFTQFHIALAEMKNDHSIDSVGKSAFLTIIMTMKRVNHPSLVVKLRVFAPSKEDLETLVSQ